MTSSRPPRDVLPTLSAHSLLLVDRPDLSARVGRFAIWAEGVEFTLELIARSDSAPSPRLVTTFFDVIHEGDIRFTLRLRLVDANVNLDAQTDAKTVNGYALARSGGESSYGPTQTTRVDDRFWLTPLPNGTVEFEVECAGLGLPATRGTIDLDQLSQTNK